MTEPLSKTRRGYVIAFRGRPLSVGDPITQDLLDYLDGLLAERERERVEHDSWIRLAGRLAARVVRD